MTATTYAVVCAYAGFFCGLVTATIYWWAKLRALESLQQRIDKYLKTKNTEYLIDAANFAMIEFLHSRFPDAFFEATDREGSPGRVLTTGRVSDRSNAEIAGRAAVPRRARTGD